MINYGSVCSGVEAASLAWEQIGWRASWFSEIEPFPSSVLAHHWPHVPNLGDMTKIADQVLSGQVSAPSVLVGGTPCQAFSVAGLRQSLDDDRGQLTIKFLELANAIDDVRRSSGDDECIVVWENVPGVLSTKDNAFGCFLAGLAGESEPLQPAGKKWTNAGCVFGPERTVAWRVLDAQYFGVAQRRRRVFVVASARDGFDPCQVLFEFEGMRRDSAPSRETREAAAAAAGAGIASGCFWDGGQLTQTLDAVLHKGQTMPEKNRFPAVLQPIAFPANLSGTQCASAENIAPVIGATNPTAVALSLRGRDGGGTAELGDEVQNCLRASGGGVMMPNMKVRRLTPRECERLQGMPDDHTLVPHRGKAAVDGPRYKAIGNSMAVPCMEFIGRRIQEQICPNRQAGV